MTVRFRPGARTSRYDGEEWRLTVISPDDETRQRSEANRPHDRQAPGVKAPGTHNTPHPGHNMRGGTHHPPPHHHRTTRSREVHIHPRTPATRRHHHRLRRARQHTRRSRRRQPQPHTDSEDSDTSRTTRSNHRSTEDHQHNRVDSRQQTQPAEPHKVQASRSADPRHRPRHRRSTEKVQETTTRTHRSRRTRMVRARQAEDSSTTRIRSQTPTSTQKAHDET